MTGQIIFDPLIEWPLVWLAITLATVMISFAIWRGLVGWWLRALAAITLAIALANPSLQQEERTPLTDIVLLVVDDTASQNISDRPDQTQQALETLRARIQARPNTELRIVTLRDGEGDSGTELMTSLSQALSEEPQARVAGMLLLTDGQLHDLERAPALPAPLHVLLTGREQDWDRRLTVKNAPAFAILGEEVTLTLRVDDEGAVPVQTDRVQLQISVDGEAPQLFTVPIGEDLDLPVSLPHGGMNVIQFTVAEAEGEITDRNNSAVVQINGVRDRLRVLLVSGEPHAGERTWRNLLKSDSSVDLVHFTILRPPDKHDGVPVEELSLIAFPTRELFIEKIDEFDLIIFDRYKRRGILPGFYIESIGNYVRNGGAVLVAAGPDFASADSLYRSALGEIMPAAPTARVIEEAFLPEITELGHRHPVTEGLQNVFRESEMTQQDDPEWGRWFRLIEVTPTDTGSTVMSGLGDRPLLVLDRVDEGRVALMASDHAWLWSRGYEGGGPQLELLRRLAHWLMKEPELEEEALWAEANGQTMTVIRRTLGESVGTVTITGPDGEAIELEMQQVSPGRFEAIYEAPEIGLYRLAEGDEDAVVALGPSAPREFVETIASGDKLEPLVDRTRGGVIRLEDGVPSIRDVRQGRPAAGRGWIGLTPREAYVTADVTITSLVPAWLFLVLAALFATGAWLREGRR
ncbi:hypothetical protein [Parasulfitobacter algicola]|uniref:Glutamine amidotransferase domain-containing protein n=1 Tax=Parasulfitobacter algicola TaxID=2614809 RepID=A0ABX2IPR8_9RHOB|nr:hypothetical protein [Sulfitobacter algicola]NSX54858.1 hypothetical protein [Sulfitobacter algicola]